MEFCLSFNVWTHGFDKRDIRELLALSLREKSAKWGEEIMICMDPWKMRGRVFLGCSSCLEKSQRRSEV